MSTQLLPRKTALAACALLASACVGLVACNAPAPGAEPGVAAPARGGAADVASQRPRRAPPPNVVVVVFDTTRADRCSVHGYDRATTPVMEELAAEGVAFDHCWSPSPWTAPAHASLFTGLRPSTHGFMADRLMFLEDGFVTLAEILGARGYATGCFTGNNYISEQFGLTQGFSESTFFDERGDVTYPVAPHTHRAAADFALSAHAMGRPFFVFVNVVEPHAKYEPPAEIARRFVPEGAPAGEVAAARAFGFPLAFGASIGARSVPESTRALISDLYDAEIATADAALRILIDGLRNADVLDNTIVVVTGDHGENLGEHGLFEHCLSLHRTLLHVPLVIRYPPRLAAGAVVDDVVRLEDVLPTVLDLCDLPAAEGIDGQTMLSDLPGRVAIAEYGFSETMLTAARRHFPEVDASMIERRIRSAFDGRFHLIRYSDGTEEFYDVVADPLETRQLRDSSLPARGRLGALLER